MTTIQLLVVCVTVLLLAAMVVGGILGRRNGTTTLSEPESLLSLAPGQKVAVHLGDGQSLRGEVAETTADFMVLRDGEFLAGGTGTGGAATAVGGLARIPVERIVLVQELPSVRSVGKLGTIPPDVGRREFRG